MKFLLCIFSMVVILFSGLSVYRENITPEWRKHQRDYLEQINKRQALKNIHKPDAPFFTIELRQIWLPELNRADRCVSCHVAIENPQFKNSKHPLKAHPEMHLESHDPQKFGCTICHDGQGRAVNFKDATGDEPDVFWNKPLLRKPFIEANCYRCHVDILDQTPAYNKGKQQFETSGCLGCHKRDGKGGLVGPELAGIGDAGSRIKYPQKSFDPGILSQLYENKNIAYIYESVVTPGTQPENTLMFDFKLSPDQAMALTVYLKSLTMHQTGIRRLPQTPVCPQPLIKKGQTTFQLYCTACHGKQGKGGVRNPNYIDEYIPRLNSLSEQMFLYKKEKQDAVISILDKSGDLLSAGLQPDIPGFFKVVAKYMSAKNIIENGRVVEKKNNKGPSPLNMPVWKKTISEKEIISVIAYLISVY